MKDAEFEKLVEEYLAGNLDAEAKKRLFDHYEYLQTEPPAWDESLMGEREIVKTSLYSRILKDINVRQRKVIWSLISAAALLVFIPLSILFYNTSEKKTEINKYVDKEDLVPGGDKALLILADGSQISLDNVKNGTLTTQGKISINKTEEGQLVYVQANDDKPVRSSVPKYNTVKTPKAGQYKVILSDGTKVWLNAVSSIRFPAIFAKEERRVEITGEVYFEVAKDKNRPFRVHAPSQVVEVLGTRFNINAYQGEEAVKTTLLEGSVKVLNTDRSQADRHSKLLRPGQQSIVKPNDNSIDVREVETEDIIAWKDGYFQFNNADIETVMRQVERWYDVEVVYEGKISDNQLSGKISRNVSASKILEMLRYFGVTCKVEGRIIRIMN